MMKFNKTKMKKTIALVAHDARKSDLLDWVEYNIEFLKDYKLVCTGTTGRLISELFESKEIEVDLTRLKSGPLGGDQQIGALITEGQVDLLVFLTDSLSMQPHDVDIKALDRLVRLYNVAYACNRYSADCILSSPTFIDPDYVRANNDDQIMAYQNRQI